jgi:hypothetical protein
MQCYFYETTVELTVRGDTRTVTATIMHDENGKVWKGAVHKQKALYRKGAGKVWSCYPTIWPTKDGGWEVSRNAVFMNRNGYRLIGWEDEKVGYRSEHNSA